MNVADSIALFLTDFIEKSSSKVATGTQIASILKISHPGLRFADFGCVNLRGFLRAHAPRIQEVSRSGADFVYGLIPKGGVPDQSSQTLPKPPNPLPQKRFDDIVWRTLSNPRSPNQVHANRVTGELRVSPLRGDEVIEPWVLIPSVTLEFHREIATEFTNALKSEGQRSALHSAMTKPRWWVDFYGGIKQAGKLREWNIFRSRQITQNIEETLKSKGIPSHWSPKQQVNQLVTAPQIIQAPRSTPQSNDAELVTLRRIAQKAIQRMSLSELRALNVPLGYAIDDLNIK